MKYYIGVDGGGTKTAISAASADSSVILTGLTGSASWREYGINHVIKDIKKTIETFPLGPDASIAGITMGLPCYGESGEGDRELESEARMAFPGIPLYLTNDVEVGWAGSLGLTPGVSVVAGTGSIAFGKNEAGKTVRCGGWSEFFSDEGSCYWVGRKIIELFSKQADGRIPKDELYEIVRNEFKLNNDLELIDIIHSDYMTNRDKTASLQVIARVAARSGSESAKRLYKEAAAELCLLVASISDRLQFTQLPFPVSYSGGLYRAQELILPHFFAGVEDLGGKPVTPKFEPMYGALLLAFEKNHPEGLKSLQKQLEEKHYGINLH